MIGFKRGNKRGERGDRCDKREDKRDERVKHGNKKWGIDIFIDEEGGYTSISVACALLAALTLVFSLAQGIWVSSAAAKVQSVADSASLSAQQATKAFTTVAQVADASVLSLGLCGVFLIGVGTITALVPGLGGAGAKILDCGRGVLDARKTFATTAAQGLSTLEQFLPYAQAANAFLTVCANADESGSYIGIALPFPATGQSEYGLAEDVDDEELASHTEEAQKASDKADEAKEKLDELLERAWRADNVDEPMCAYSRAHDLANLSDVLYPRVTQIESWTFGSALLRARAYYEARAQLEAPASSSVEEKTNSAMRKQFYLYALKKMNEGYYLETGTSVSMDLPALPHNVETTKETELYTNALWPCSEEEGQKTLHAFANCPGASGEAAGLASLKDVDDGSVSRCAICGADITAQGSVASASTSINNGFEYYWKIIEEASKEWQDAKNEYSEAQDELEEIAEQTSDLFEKALAALAVPRPHLLPPGAYGCIGVVMRGESTLAPSELINAFSSETTLPAGVAISGAVLAPDNTLENNSVLSRFFDFLTQGQDGGIPGVLSGITSLWGDLLCSYGSAANTVSDVANSFLGGLDAVGAGSVARWLANKINSLVIAAGFEPADLRIRKPVLCNTQEILAQDGSYSAGYLRDTLMNLPAGGSAYDLLSAFGRQVFDELTDKEVTLAELEIPGTSLSIPITVNIKDILGVLT